MGDSPCQQPPKDAKKGAFIYRDDTLKTVSNLSLRFPEYGMANANNCSPCQQPPKGEKGGTYLMELRLFNGMMQRIKNSVKCSRGILEYGMTKANNFRWVLPCQQPQKGEKGIFFKGMGLKGK